LIERKKKEDLSLPQKKEKGRETYKSLSEGGERP